MIPVASALYVGSVMHHRLSGPRHRFQYPLFMWLLDLDELPQLGRWVRGFGYNCRRPVSFCDADHLGGEQVPVLETIRDLVSRAGQTWPAGPVRVLTHCRVLGYVFNPVTFWYCYTPERALDVIVAEVSNTFGERHCYVAGRERWAGPRTADTNARWIRWSDKKVFHVSPFMSLEGTYDFAVEPPADSLRVRIDLRRGRTQQMAAALVLRRESLSATSVARTLVRYPLMTARVIGAIHWEALRLWFKGARYHPKPPYDPDRAREGVV